MFIDEAIWNFGFRNPEQALRLDQLSLETATLLLESFLTLRGIKEPNSQTNCSV